jgi:hypothetical protein
VKVGDMITIKHCGAYNGWAGVIVSLVDGNPHWTGPMYEVLIDGTVQAFTSLQIVRV